MKITKNVGALDSIIRIFAGLLILSTISLVYLGPRSDLAYLGFVGLIPLVTGVVGKCGLYDAIGVSTCKKSEEWI